MPSIAIGALAGVLRLWSVDLAPLRYDDVDVLSRARAVVSGELTATGPLTSWGIPDPPVSVYLATLPAALPHSAAASAAWFALLNVGAVVLTYLLARRFFGPSVGLAAGLLFAVNPWAVYFSRRSWAEIVPLFTTVALGSAYMVVACRRSRWAVPFFVALALQVQTRILALIYAPAALAMLGLFPRRWGVRWPLLGIGLGVLLSVPYATWVLTHWGELAARLAAGNRGFALTPTHSAPELVLWLAAGFNLLPVSGEAAPWLTGLGQVNRVALVIASGLLLAGLGVTAWAVACRRPGWERPLLASAWLLLPVGALVAQSSSVYLHYLVALFPALFLVMGLPLGALLDRHALMPRLLGGGLLGAICLVQVATTATLYHILGAWDLAEPPTTSLDLRQAAARIPRETSDLIGTGEQYGVEPPIRFWQALTDRAREEAARSNARAVMVLAGETDPLTAERPAILDYLLRPELEPRFVAADTLVFPVGRPGLVVEAPNVDPIESIERFGERRASVPVPSTNRAGRDFAYVTFIPERGPQGWESLVPSRLPTAFEQDTHFIGFRAATRALRAGEDLVLTSFWRVGPSSPAASIALRLRGPSGGPPLVTEPAAQPLPTVEPNNWVLARRQRIAVPAQAPAGEYRLELQVLDSTGRALRQTGDGSDRLILTTVQVSAR